MVQEASTTILRTSVETQDLRSGYVMSHLRRVLVEGGGSKLGFGDEHPEFNLVVDSPSLVHVRRFLLEGVA
jgi:hypothetical protein